MQAFLTAPILQLWHSNKPWLIKEISCFKDNSLSKWKKVKEKSLNVEIRLFLFDTFISSVPDYGCETKSFRIALKTEKVQIDFSKIYQ